MVGVDSLERTGWLHLQCGIPKGAVAGQGWDKRVHD